MRALSIALVHHPVLDATGGVVTSTLTTIDMHDLSRSARTYGCEALYIVHPIPAQQELALKVLDHWTHGSSAKRIPDRKEALATIKVVPTLEDAQAACGTNAELWTTAARAVGRTTSWDDAKHRLTATGGPPILLAFGTSWGLAPSVFDRATILIEPIHGIGDWNHLSVRSACAIALDRLCAGATKSPIVNSDEVTGQSTRYRRPV